MPETSPDAGLTASGRNFLVLPCAPFSQPHHSSPHFALLLHEHLRWQSLQSFIKGFWQRLKWNRYGETEASKERQVSFQELISPCTNSLPESSSKKTSTASQLWQEDRAAFLGGLQLNKTVQMRDIYQTGGTSISPCRTEKPSAGLGAEPQPHCCFPRTGEQATGNVASWLCVTW